MSTILGKKRKSRMSEDDRELFNATSYHVQAEKPGSAAHKHMTKEEKAARKTDIDFIKKMSADMAAHAGKAIQHAANGDKDKSMLEAQRAENLRVMIANYSSHI